MLLLSHSFFYSESKIPDNVIVVFRQQQVVGIGSVLKKISILHLFIQTPLIYIREISSTRREMQVSVIGRYSDTFVL